MTLALRMHFWDTWPAVSGDVFELNLLGIWTDVSTDIVAQVGVTGSYGITGADPLDLVGTTGRMSFSLLNNESNSGGVVGYYSPGHVNCRPGFTVGIGFRYCYRLANSNTYYRKFQGWVDSIQAEPGKARRYSQCLAVDFMDEAARHKPVVETQVNKGAFEILATLIAAMPRQPYTTNFDVGDSIFPYGLDNSRAEQNPVLTEMQRLAQSEYGRIYNRGGLNLAGMELRGEKRSARLIPIPVAVLDGDFQGLIAPVTRDRIRNKIKTTVHPRRIDALPTSVLFSNQGTPLIASGETLMISAFYTDPNNSASRVGGLDMVAPVATTDYLMNTAADGTGTDLTSSATILVEYGANSAEYTITNTSGSPGYLTRLQARGRGLYDYTAIDVLSVDDDSIVSFGEIPLGIDMPYQSDTAIAQAVGDYVLSVSAEPNSTQITVRYKADGDERKLLAMSLEPGMAVTVRDSATGVDSVYFIQSVKFILGHAKFPVFEWIMQRAPVATFWQLDVSALDLDTIAAPL